MKVKFANQLHTQDIAVTSGTDGGEATKLTLPDLAVGEAYLLKKVSITVKTGGTPPTAEAGA